MMTKTRALLAKLNVALILIGILGPATVADNLNVLRVGDGQTYTTIQAAVDAVNPGEIVLVYPGTYIESVSVTGSGYDIIAQDQGVVVTPPAEGEACFEVKADDVTIRGFDLTGTSCAPAIRFEGSNNTFASNYIHGLTCPGVNALECRDPDGGSNFNVIEHNVVTQADLGIVVISNADNALNKGNIIRNNTVSNVDQVGIVIENGTDFEIYGNVIQDISIGHGISIIASNNLPQKNHYVADNTILGCAGNGIALFADYTATLAKCTILGNDIETVGEMGIYLYRQSGATLKKNRVVENSVRAAAVIGILVEDGSKENRLKSNFIVTSVMYGIAVLGKKNKIRDNTVLESGIYDLEDHGSGNTWLENRYETSSWEDNRSSRDTIPNYLQGDTLRLPSTHGEDRARCRTGLPAPRNTAGKSPPAGILR